jgi:hypothetical protein
MWRSMRSDSVILLSDAPTSTRFAAGIVVECARRWRSRTGAVRAESVKVGSVAYVQDLWEVLSSERFVMTVVSFKPETFVYCCDGL